MTNAILRLPAVKATVGLSRSSIYAAMAAGAFPRPIQLGARAIGWLQADIENWVAKRIAQSRKCA